MSAAAAITLDPVIRLSRDLATAAKTLSVDEARFLVDSYYQMQENRITANNQIRSMQESGEPHLVLQWLAEQSDVLEKQLKRALDRWTEESTLGVWLKSITGIGPVLSAGFISNISVELKRYEWDIVRHEEKTEDKPANDTLIQTFVTKAGADTALKAVKKVAPGKYEIVQSKQFTVERIEAAGALWRYAGLDPTSVWNKGEKRPWNASLKRICWLAGESFVKVSGNDSDVYGKIYLKRKEYEQQKNEALDYADQAKAALEKKRIGKDTEAFRHYSGGALPPAQIHARAKRYAVKILLSHYHTVAYFLEFGTLPAKPFAIEILGHAHYIPVPNANLVPGLEEALRRR